MVLILLLWVAVLNYLIKLRYLMKMQKIQYKELSIAFKGDYGVIFRAYNDGVAYRFYTKKKGEITILSEEAVKPYYRPALSDYLSEDLQDKKFYVYEEEWYRENRVEVKTACRVEALDTADDLDYQAKRLQILQHSVMLAQSRRQRLNETQCDKIRRPRQQKNGDVRASALQNVSFRRSPHARACSQERVAGDRAAATANVVSSAPSRSAGVLPLLSSALSAGDRTVRPR